MELSQCLAPKVVGKVVALERREGPLITGVDQQTRHKKRSEEGTERIEVSTRRPDKRFFPSPVLNSRHAIVSPFSGCVWRAVPGLLQPYLSGPGGTDLPLGLVFWYRRASEVRASPSAASECRRVR